MTDLYITGIHQVHDLQALHNTSKKIITAQVIFFFQYSDSTKQNM
ncbi:hypothetical protein [Pseudoalteromonas luteoviolacea]|nr:hypothetical protein [Pseudoalteromonas luteoviolacea]